MEEPLHGLVSGRSVTLARLIHPPRWAVIAVALGILAVIVWLVVIPQYSSAVTSLATLESLSVPLVALAVFLELGSLVAFSGMTATVLGQGRPPYATLLRIDLTDLGLNHVVPGGGTTAAAVRFGLLKRVGVPSADALTGAAIEVTASNMMLGIVFGAGLVLSITRFGGNAAIGAATVLVAAFFILAGLVCWILTRHSRRAVEVVRALAEHIPIITPASVERVVLIMAARITELLSDPPRLGRLALLGAANWLLDAAALWVVLAAFGSPVSIGAVLTVYGVGSILAMLPITPGGIGVVEGVMVPALIAFGVPAPLALLGVVGWRLMEYWLPIPLAGVAYVSLRFTVLRHPGTTGVASIS
ncbi:MAG: hypothetical protein JWP75_3071 [Frondihabitans sp.]|nr:hypothetical protein [Frondihabitans sp.]